MREDTITHVTVTGMASIDGPASLNNNLSTSRARAMAKWLEKNALVPASLITIDSRGEDWSWLRHLVNCDGDIPDREKLLEIMSLPVSSDEKEAEIKSLEDGKTWDYLKAHILPKMRCVEIYVKVKHHTVVSSLPIDMPIEEVIEEEVIEEVIIEEIPEDIIEAEPEPQCEVREIEIKESIPSEWQRNFYIKTDLPYWLMFWSNVAFEIDLAPHWSFNLPIYFSAMNYFRRDLKFRLFAFQPGVRYWIKGENKGVFFEAHYGMGWWNFAFAGEFRYQDHRRRSPALGGGVGAGYRLPISANGRWAMEFGAGVGYYHLYYDRFQNRPNGKYVDSHKKNIFFIDNINVSISYSFPINNKKGGNQ
ncbi:MAG: DUF3575 domain-containing protein [Muribaculaceae bacterium]|nr:DUF3575 domain-containing protein [Muribaculaceae bacterium]